MKIQESLIIGVGSIFILFLMLTFFYSVGSNYGIDETSGNTWVNLSELQENIDQTESTSKVFEDIFKSDNIAIISYNFVAKGVPSATKTLYTNGIGSIKIVLVGARKIFSNTAISIGIGLFMAVFIIIFIINIWDWIRGNSPLK